MTSLIRMWRLGEAVLGLEKCGALAACPPAKMFRAMTEEDRGEMQACPMDKHTVFFA